jgi:hypothetical protein
MGVPFVTPAQPTTALHVVCDRAISDWSATMSDDEHVPHLLPYSPQVTLTGWDVFAFAVMGSWLVLLLVSAWLR